MFVRKKPNRSGTVSVQIIDKSSGRYRVIKTVGSSSDSVEVEKLYHQGIELIPRMMGQKSIAFAHYADFTFVNTLKNNIKSHKLIGPSLVLDRMFDEIGFNKIEGDLFRHLVISRLTYPRSKLKTVEYLNRYFGLHYDVYKVYRYLDELHGKHKQEIQQISYEHTLKILGGVISVVFYDVTTIYFEAEQEDELRVTGFSKDGKHQNPQIVLGLLVGMNGYPLAYQLYEGNKFEGHTMIPVLESFRETFQIEDMVVIADAGLMSKENVERLTNHGLQYILGARLKNMPKEVINKTLALSVKDGQQAVIALEGNTRLVISYSAKRAKKDAHNRKRGLRKLEKSLAGGKLTKQHINNRGYNKYLSISGEVDIAIDYDKFNEDARWDGLKGYVTNTNLKAEQVIENYKQLWSIEKAFRISKTDLRIRPVFHRLAHRIETHIAISFCAYKIYKELERQLKLKGSDKSPARVIEVLNSIFAIEVALPYSQQIATFPIITENEQSEILAIFGLDNLESLKYKIH